MRITRTTTIYQDKRKKEIVPSENDLLIFQQLKDLLGFYVDSLEIRINTPQHYEVWTKDWVYIKTHLCRKVQFAAIIIYEKHVGLHFHPLAIDRSIKDGLREEVQILSKGTAVFHFISWNEEIEKGIKELFEIGWACYKKLKLVR
jgi:hypothetical protein